MSETVLLEVEGMTCDGCVASVENALRRVDGVIDAAAELEAHRASVTFDPTRVDRQALADAIEDAGFDVA